MIGSFLRWIYLIKYLFEQILYYFIYNIIYTTWFVNSNYYRFANKVVNK